MDESISSIDNNVNYQEPNNDVIQIETKKNWNSRIKKVLLVVVVLAVLWWAYYIYSNTNLLKSKDIEISTIVETNTWAETDSLEETGQSKLSEEVKEEVNSSSNKEVNSLGYCDGFRKEDWKLYLYEEIYDSKWIDLPSLEFLTCSVAKDKNNVFIAQWGDYTTESLEKVSYPIDAISFDKKICDELWIYCSIFTTNTNLYCFSSSSILKDLWSITTNRNESYQKYWDYFRLLNKIFIDCREVKWADADSFSTITWKNFLWKDKNHLYFGKDILWINPHNYKFVQIGLGPVEFIMDDKSIYAISYSNNPVKKLEADPLSFGLIESSEDEDNIFKDWKWNVFYGCTSPEGDLHIYDIVKIEWINLYKIKIIENHIGNSEGVYWILEDDKYRYTIKCDQEQKVIKTSK